MSKKISIKVTEAQPLPCPYCNGFYGGTKLPFTLIREGEEQVE